MRNKDFAIFILSHGRADNVITVRTLKKTNYSGKVYFLVDDTDKDVEKYKENFGKENVFVFNKQEALKDFDIMDNFKDDRAVVFARNYIYKVAKKIGLKYFLVLDDDYTIFSYKYDKNLVFKHQRVSLLDEVLDAYLDYYKSINARSIAMSQTGDFIGGDNGFVFSITRLRKCMNSFFCSVDRPIEFRGRINEDVNTYTSEATVGKLYLTVPWICLDQQQTQGNKGGLTEIYLNLGTYVKSFYSVMIQPSSITVNVMGETHRRLHHNVRGINTYPMIINEKYKKI